MDLLTRFRTDGYLRFAADEGLARWAALARTVGAEAARDPAHAHWLRCGGTWFVGVDALPNDAAGRIGDGPPLAGAAIDFIRGALGFALPLHRAQLSICHPGYPQPSPEESEAAYRFRRNRDAAHVDGVHGIGPEKRRFLQEPHGYILGITLTAQSPDAAPLVVWPGSQLVMREMFRHCFEGRLPERWPEIDVTAPYQEARRRVFETLPRLELPTGPGEAVLLDRHMLHGVAPWGPAACAEPEGRMIAYFRPEFGTRDAWLTA